MGETARLADLLYCVSCESRQGKNLTALLQNETTCNPKGKAQGQDALDPGRPADAF